jgi:hypothetical protein
MRDTEIMLATDKELEQAIQTLRQRDFLPADFDPVVSSSNQRGAEDIHNSQREWRYVRDMGQIYRLAASRGMTSNE